MRPVENTPTSTGARYRFVLYVNNCSNATNWQPKMLSKLPLYSAFCPQFKADSVASHYFPICQPLTNN